jgi:hypothetical protein
MPCLNPESNKEIPNSQYVHDLQECLAFIHNFAREKLKLSGQTMKKYYDHKSYRRLETFKQVNFNSS